MVYHLEELTFKTGREKSKEENKNESKRTLNEKIICSYGEKKMKTGRCGFWDSTWRTVYIKGRGENFNTGNHVTPSPGSSVRNFGVRKVYNISGLLEGDRESTNRIQGVWGQYEAWGWNRVSYEASLLRPCISYTLFSGLSSSIFCYYVWGIPHLMAVKETTIDKQTNKYSHVHNLPYS